MLNWIKQYSKWVTIFVLGVALIAVYKTFNSFEFLGTLISTIIYAIKPFILAFVIAYLINIPTKKLYSLLKEKGKYKFIKKHTWALSIAVSYVCFVILMIIVFCAVVPMLFNNCIEMIKNLPDTVRQLIKLINSFEIMQRLGVSINIDDVSDAIGKWVQTLNASTIGKYASGALNITSSIMSVFSGVMSVFISMIASIYMLIDKDRLIEGIKQYIRLFSKSNRVDGIIEHFTSINSIFTQYIYSRLICCAIMAIACTLVLAIMGEKYALILGLFIGIMDMIPYFGSIISWTVGFVLMFVSGGVFHAIWCSIAMLVMQQLDGNVLAPKITGNRLEIRPLTIIIAVSVGGSLFGFIGMLIAVPIVAILRAIFVELVQTKKSMITEDEPEEERAGQNASGSGGGTV